LKELGVLLSPAGAHGNVLKIRPPLVFDRSHADIFLGAFDEVLEALDD
jgi:4-aminobutyrate aminotransferase-like enzyme